MTATIDPLTIDDAAAIARVMADAFDPRFGEAWNPGQCLALFGLQYYAMSGAWTGSGVGRVLAGFAFARDVADESELLLLAVSPAARRGGIGRALVLDWLAGSAARGVRRHLLEVREDNPAIALYSALGFTAVGIRPDYYRGSDGSRRPAMTMARGSQ